MIPFPAASRRRLLLSLVVGGLAAAGLRAGFAPALCKLFGMLALVNGAGVLGFDLLLPLLRVPVAAIVRDLTLAAGYLAAVLGGLSAAGVNLSGLVATSAVVTAIIAFSLQDTLGNIMGGMVLQLDRSLEVGDWVRVGTDEGWVREIRWRQTKIETGSGEVLFVPNSQLMKGVITVSGRGSRPGMRRIAVPFSVEQDVPPSRVLGVVEGVLRSDLPPLVAAYPAPNCFVTGFDGASVHYSASVWITDVTESGSVGSAVRTRIYYALARHGIRLAIASQAVVAVKNDAAAAEKKRRTDLERRLTALRGVDLFRALQEEELRVLAERLKVAPFTRGEVITRQGTQGHWLYILDKGEAEVRVEADGGPGHSVATLRPGEFMGEMALMTGEARSATVVAATDVECLRLDREAFRDVVAKRPELAERISHVLAERKVALDAAREALDHAARARLVVQTQGDLLTRIRTFFALR